MVNAVKRPVMTTEDVMELIYDDDAELTGQEVETANFGKVKCAPGSIAYKAGAKDIVMLDNHGQWQAV